MTATVGVVVYASAITGSFRGAKPLSKQSERFELTSSG